MRSCQFEYFIAFLFRNQTESQFRHRMTGDDCLCPLPLISSADSIDFGCWSSPDALERIVTGFAEKFGDSCFLQDQFVASTGSLRHASRSQFSSDLTRS